MLKNTNDHVDLLTTKGALSKRQLKQALRYMSYQAQLLNSSALLLYLYPLPLGELLAFTAGTVYPAIISVREQESNVAGLAQMIAGGYYGLLMEFLPTSARKS